MSCLLALRCLRARWRCRAKGTELCNSARKRGEDRRERICGQTPVWVGDLNFIFFLSFYGLFLQSLDVGSWQLAVAVAVAKFSPLSRKCSWCPSFDSIRLVSQTTLSRRLFLSLCHRILFIPYVCLFFPFFFILSNLLFTLHPFFFVFVFVSSQIKNK